MKKLKKKVLPQIKELLIDKVTRMVRDPVARRNMIAKVRSIRFAGVKCQATNEIAGVLTTNAFYQPNNNTFTYCLGMNVLSKSRFALAFVVAHELSHSVDPCNLTIGPSDWAFKYKTVDSDSAALRQYPIANVLECLRSEKSVGAKSFFLNPPAASSYGTYGDYGVPSAYPSPSNTQPKSFDPSTAFCSHQDQIVESFADWMAAEITPDYIAKNHPKLTTQQMRNGYSNIFKSGCGEAESDTDVHPLMAKRVDYLTLMQPKIRKQMGCAAQVPERITCDYQTPAPSESKEIIDILPNSTDESQSPRSDH
jgi:hypothetical protein